MDIATLIQVLNQGLPAEALGGLTSAAIIGLVNKAKNLFKNKEITAETITEVIESNPENKEILESLDAELLKHNVKIYIKTQINNSTLNNPTFN